MTEFKLQQTRIRKQQSRYLEINDVRKFMFGRMATGNSDFDFSRQGNTGNLAKLLNIWAVVVE